MTEAIQNSEFRILNSLVPQLYERASAGRWHLPLETFRAAIEASLAHAFAGRVPSSSEVERFAVSLHLEDLALACACGAGLDPAWEHFVREYRPALYRAAAALDPGGNARELADSMYGELFGLAERGGVRQTLFRYFHGRSSLLTWMRAVLAQRHVDRLRGNRRLEPLPDDPAIASPAPSDASAGERARFVTIVQDALSAAVASLAPRDRLRLSFYYAQGMTLADIGRVLKEHEATVSRHLARTRREVRNDVERRLSVEQGFDAQAILECLQAVVADPGSLDLGGILGTCKNSSQERSEL